MARLSDFSPQEQEHHLQKIRDLPDFGDTPYAPGPALNRRRVALVGTSGVHVRGDQAFDIGEAGYRVIPGDTPPQDLLMSHSSVNFDRSGFQEDVNVVFPLQRLRELAADGVIGSVADFHYAFMGAASIRAMAPAAKALAGLLKKDRVDAVVLLPV